MNIFGIADLHLSFLKKVVPGKWEDVEEHKSMDIFGKTWEKHYRQLYENWLATVKEDDLVLIPGDISWANTLEEARYDFDFINILPGKKILIKGNHDYWWQGINRLRSSLPDNFYLIQNDSLKFNNITIAGSRGWLVPGSKDFSEHDKKIYNRELKRLELSLDTVSNASRMQIVMLHYMPVNEKHEKNEIIELLINRNVDICLYGHLHDEAHQIRLEGRKWGVNFQLISADFTGFKPLKIIEV